MKRPSRDVDNTKNGAQKQIYHGPSVWESGWTDNITTVMALCMLISYRVLKFEGTTINDSVSVCHAFTAVTVS